MPAGRESRANRPQPGAGGRRKRVFPANPGGWSAGQRQKYGCRNRAAKLHNLLRWAAFDAEGLPQLQGRFYAPGHILMRRAYPSSLFSRRLKAFTLVEVMVVVVIIGFLAAAGLPGYRHLTMRSKVTALENDLRQFSTAIQTYALQNGHWPADSDPQVTPPELATALPNNFALPTPIGGVYKWNYDASADGITAKAAIIVETAGGSVINDDVELLQMVDRQMDDGNLETGTIQVGSTNSLVFIIEK